MSTSAFFLNQKQLFIVQISHPSKKIFSIKFCKLSAFLTNGYLKNICCCLLFKYQYDRRGRTHLHVTKTGSDFLSKGLNKSVVKILIRKGLTNPSLGNFDGKGLTNPSKIAKIRKYC